MPIPALVGSALIGGASSLLGGLFGSSSADAAQRQQMEWQEKMWQKQADWSAEQAQLNRQFQSDEAAKLRDYNSLASQVQRASAAGVNPWSLVQGSSFSNSTSAQPAGSSPSLPSFPTPAESPALQKSQSFNAVAQGIAQLAGVGKTIADAKKTGVETSQLEQMFDKVVKQADLQNEALDIANGIQKIVLQYQDKISRREADKLFQEIKVLGSSDMVNIETLRQIKSQVVKNLADSDQSKAMARQINKYVDSWMDKINASEVNKNNASAADSYSHVDVNRTQSIANLSQSDLNQSLRKLNGLAFDIRSSNSDKEKRMLSEQYINAAEQAGVITGLMKQRLEQAVRDNDWAVVKNIFDLVESGTRSFSNVVAPVKISSSTPVHVGGFGSR